MIVSVSSDEITINQVTVSCIHEGPDNGPVVIFIHGYPLNKSMWEEQIAVLKNKYRVIAYDMRGHGKTQSGSDEFSISLLAGDLINLMDGLKIDTAIVCGISMGGYVAIQAVLNFPTRFTAMILCDTQCVADTTEQYEKRLQTVVQIMESGVEKYAQELLPNLFSTQTSESKNTAVARVKDMIENTSTHSLSQSLHALANRTESCTRLQEIDLPVLIVVGALDTITPPEKSKHLNERIKGSVLKIIPDAGHLSTMEQPEVFNTLLMQFLNSLT